jgi:hypothetical protein
MGRPTGPKHREFVTALAADEPPWGIRNTHGLLPYFQNNYFAKLAPVLAKEITT